MTCKIAVVKVRLCYKLAGIFVRSMSLKNHLTWMGLRPLLKKDIFLSREIEVTDQLEEPTETCLAYKKESETKDAQFNKMASQRLLLQ